VFSGTVRALPPFPFRIAALPERGRSVTSAQVMSMAMRMWFWIEFRAASMREDWGAITKPTI
jgi:hypothetical protein